MDLVLPFAIGATTFLALVCFWLAWNRLSTWQPVVARRRGSDYSEVEQEEDRTFGGAFRNWRLTDDDGRRWTHIDVSYADTSGTEHRTTIGRYIRRGSILDGYFPVWYEKANPDRASAWGPLSFALTGLLLGFAVFELLRLTAAVR